MSTPQSFFQLCLYLLSAFFSEIFRQFTALLLVAFPPRYAARVAPVHSLFTDILLLYCSRLAAISHPLKLLWRERAVVLPRCPPRVYDLRRALCPQLHFSADAAASEMTRARAIRVMARDTLLLAIDDCTADFFEGLHTQRCWGLFPRNRLLSLRKLQRLSKRRHAGGCLEDWLVRAGTGASAPPQLVRYIRWRHGGTRYELLTNVLAPARLAAAEALALYPDRWRIERMYFYLKEVLNLNRIYAANPNAVAMQVYAAEIVYNALRVAQGSCGRRRDRARRDLAGEVLPQDGRCLPDLRRRPTLRAARPAPESPAPPADD